MKLTLRTAFCAAFLICCSSALAQGVPSEMSYQAVVTDDNGDPLSPTSPTSYEVTIRIFPGATGGASLWTERHVTSVFDGRFAVILGQGAPVPAAGGGNEPRPDLGNVFTQSLRFTEITVRENVGGAVAKTLAPRQKIVASATAFRARVAETALVANSLAPGTLSANAIPNGLINANMLAANSVANSEIASNAVTSAKIASNTITAAEIGANAVGTSEITDGSINIADLAAAVQRELVPPGTIMAYGGDTAPPGWYMCDGTFGISPAGDPKLFAVIGYRFGGYTSNGTHWFLAPDLRGRFLRGRDGGVGRDPDRASRTRMYAEGATGDAVGSVQGDEFKSHTHQWLGSNGNNSPSSVDFTASEFGSKNQYQNTLPTGGNETRPINAYVNFIIKR